MHQVHAPPAARVAKSRSAELLKFGAGVFVSAFLLFQIQPLISKAILPWFGGTPSVWTTCMLFFQVAVSTGYAYAHLLTAHLPVRWQGLVHLTLLGTALVLLQVLPNDRWKPAGDASPIAQILLLLTATVGLPYFLLATTGPLLQQWFALSYPGRSPYRLYALSNAGSLLALLTYPFVVEPALNLRAQGQLWSLGFWVFGLLTGLCALGVMRQFAASDTKPPPTRDTSAAVPGRARRPCVLWFLLAMVASTLYLAVTNEVCQDVAVVPFLWIVPLSLYLLSFILCFDSERWYWPRCYAVATAAGVAVLCLLLISRESNLSFGWQAVLQFGLLFCGCMLCHGELARRKPDPRQLTLFYLTISAGGAAGGILVGLIAPLVFPHWWEFHLALLAISVIALGVGFTEQGWLGGERRPPLVGVVAGVALLTLVGVVFAEAVTRYATSIATIRNFYGVLSVETDPVDNTLLLQHGRIIHGIQYLDPTLRGIPTAYYGGDSGIGRALTVMRGRPQPLRIGVVGLGVGTLAAYGRPGDSFRFYEINENVVRLAEEQFEFLSRTPATVEVELGDARLSLERESPRNFDLLVLDAFSSDAIPMHLLTREALDVYLKHLAPGGVLAIHISNLHFDLRAITDALAEDAGLAGATLSHLVSAETPGQKSSDWALLTREAGFLDHEILRDIVAAPQPRRVRWTDRYSNLFLALQ